MRIGLGCREVTRLISDGQDVRLPLAKRAQMRFHFLLCGACRTVDRQMNFLRHAVRGLGQENPPGG